MYKFYRVKSFEITGPHHLRVSFDDGSTQAIDFRPVLFGEMYEPLNDLPFFERVKIDPEVHTLVWPNGADFDPTMLHDWNAILPEIRSSVAKWETVPV